MTMSSKQQYAIDKRVFTWLCHTVFQERLSRLSAANHPLAVLEQLEAESPAKGFERGGRGFQSPHQLLDSAVSVRNWKQ
ncbi:MAG: hypothetical protein JWR21_1837 [Herminiimonas sp.]|nr:hypothetical protein [Herminiimonas sp.]